MKRSQQFHDDPRSNNDVIRDLVRRKKFFRPSAALLIATLLAAASAASAHPGHDTVTPTSGFAHPFTGFDHLLAMICVGLWSTILAKRARWLLPLSFLAAMTIGAALAANGIHTNLAEHAILSSVLVLGLLIAMSARVPLAAACALVALFALFHGYAHVAEMTGPSSRTAYFAGFLLATAFLHAIGLLIGLRLQRTLFIRRLCGTVVAATATALWFLQ